MTTRYTRKEQAYPIRERPLILQVPRNLTQQIRPSPHALFYQLKAREYDRSRLSLRGDLTDLNRSDFSRSDIICHCRLDTFHYKLTATAKHRHKQLTLCPIQVLLGWQRLRMLGHKVNDDNFDVAKLLELAKG